MRENSKLTPRAKDQVLGCMVQKRLKMLITCRLAGPVASVDAYAHSKASANKLVEEPTAAAVDESNLPHYAVFLHHFLKFDADKRKMRQKNAIFAMK